MKKYILIFLIQLVFQPVFSQDSTKITYTQETDTLVKQRFIDRYENVFMTKVPTRHMFKVGISQYYQARPSALMDNKPFDNVFINFGYEFKLLPAFSVALTYHLPYYVQNKNQLRPSKNAILDGQFRWFFNMRTRIKSGKSANNFSGNYLALNYTLPASSSLSPTIGLKLGFQRRFMNAGFMDFSVALQQESPWFQYGFIENWSFHSQVNFGIAFGDWKKQNNVPICDVLMCNSELNKQLKVKLPELSFGYYLNRIRLGAAFEQKIKSSPVSINFQFDFGISRGFNTWGTGEYHGTYYNYILSRELSASFSIQPRYYFLQNRDKLMGKSTNGISGLYTGVNSEYGFYSGHHSISSGEDQSVNYLLNTLYVGPLFGFQQRLFKHGYVDFNASYNYQRELNHGTNAAKLRTNLGVGFAF